MNNNKENITNLLPKKPVIIPKEKRYVSLHHGRVVAEKNLSAGDCATLGRPHTALRQPHEYLKAGDRSAIELLLKTKNLEKTKDVRHKSCQAKPEVLKVSSNEYKERITKRESSKNFITTNVQKAREMSPPEVSFRRLDTKGRVENLISAGKWPHFIAKKGFGVVPGYLEKQASKLKEKENTSAQNGSPGKSTNEAQRQELLHLDGEKKKAILEGLQDNLLYHHRLLQRLPVVCETRMHQLKKQELEEKVEEIERNIFILSSYDVFIQN